MTDPQPQRGTCPTCGKPKLTENSTMCTDMARNQHLYYCMCVTITNSAAPQARPAPPPSPNCPLCGHAVIHYNLGMKCSKEGCNCHPVAGEAQGEAVLHDSYMCTTPHCPACWGESRQEGVSGYSEPEGDYVGIGRNGPTPRVDAGAHPDPEQDERMKPNDSEWTLPFDTLRRVVDDPRVQAEGGTNAEMVEAILLAYGVDRLQSQVDFMSSLVTGTEETAHIDVDELMARAAHPESRGAALSPNVHEALREFMRGAGGLFHLRETIKEEMPELLAAPTSSPQDVNPRLRSLDLTRHPNVVK